MNGKVIKISNSIAKRRVYVELFFFIFFCVGFAGTVNPASHDLFLRLFPAALLLSFFAIFLFHEQQVIFNDIAVFSLIAVTGFVVEVAGVSTHRVFGNYEYGNTLGIKLFDTPLLIGLNWLMLSYAAATITEKTSFSPPLKIFIASLLMLAYDAVLEQVAPLIDMWHWEDGIIPFQNYAAWFVIALVFQIFLALTGIRPKNSIAWKIVLVQLLFFIALLMFYKLGVS
jgi:putative membrane protein